MSLFELIDLQAHNADESTFATDEDGSFSGRSVRVTSRPKIDPAQSFFDDPGTRQRLEERYGKIAGLKSGSKLAPIQIPLCGTGTAAGDSTEADGAADCADGQLLKNAFGGEDLGTGTTLNDAAATTTGFTVTSAAALDVGDAVLCTTSAGLEANVIATKSTHDLTFVRAFSSAPENSSVVNAAATYYPSNPSGTMQFRSYDAEASAAYWKWLGCQLTAKLSGLNPNQEPRVDMESMVASWAEAASGSLALASYDHTTNAPVPGMATELHIQDVGTTTRNLIHYSDLKIDPGITYAAVDSGSGTEGVQSYVQVSRLPKVELTVTSFGADWFDDITSQQAFYLHLQLGATAGQTVLIEIPNMTLDAPPEKANVKGQMGLTMKFTGRGYGATETDLARAPIRLHRL